MAVMNIRSAITAESTLSYMGIGLPLEMISWGSMLSLAEKAMSGGAWWIIVIPGAFLVVTLLCITDIGEALRKAANRKEKAICNKLEKEQRKREPLFSQGFTLSLFVLIT
ncbi:MAG: hypothetical protein ACLTF6_10215 [Clostridium sp.]